MDVVPDVGPLRDPRFDAVEATMRQFVGGELIAGASWAILKGRDVVDARCVGMADREAGETLRPDHVFRVFSNTKLLTSCAVLLLHEQGLVDLDEPVDRLLPQLAAPRVLKPGATSLDDTEPARRPITVRHLMTHASGLTYGFLDPDALLARAYATRGVLRPDTPLSAMMDALEGVPLGFHPGESWDYSVATDVLARLVEVVSGRPFDAFLRERILDPLGMRDTGFFVQPAEHGRLAALYAGADLLEPMKPGLTRIEGGRSMGMSFTEPPVRHSGGGGLVSTLSDMVRLVRALVPGGPTLLAPATIAGMSRNQLPEGMWIRFPRIGVVQGKGYGLAGAVTVAPLPFDPPDSAGELQWGGVAGTHWWINARKGLAAVLMVQREMSFWHPFSFAFKGAVYSATR
jgi:CubicO group peptidase (beta-lactamase class C family)